MFKRRGLAALKSRQPDDRNNEVLQLKAKIGELTMANELLESKIERLAPCPPDNAPLLEHIRTVLKGSPFLGEGPFKVWVRLRFRGLRREGACPAVDASGQSAGPSSRRCPPWPQSSGPFCPNEAAS